MQTELVTTLGWSRPEEILPPLDQEIVVLAYDSSNRLNIAFVGKFKGNRGPEGKAVFHDSQDRPWGYTVAAWCFIPKARTEARG